MPKRPPRSAARRTPVHHSPQHRPSVQWHSVPAGEAVTAADLVLALVRLLEWAAGTGLDFDAAIQKARTAETERLSGGTPHA